jgi:hypothetical protein
MEHIIPKLPLAHYVTMFEACPRFTWIALLGAVPVAVISGVVFARRGKRAFLIIPATWCVVMLLYFIGVRIYIQSKPGGYWCRKACIENLKIIDAGKEQRTSEQIPAGDRLGAAPEE